MTQAVQEQRFGCFVIPILGKSGERFRNHPIAMCVFEFFQRGLSIGNIDDLVAFAFTPAGA
jgi:hypothetical protein